MPGAGPKTRASSRPRGADRVVVRRLVEAADQAHGVVEQVDDVGEGVAEEPGDAHGDVDPGPAELGQRDHLEALDPAGVGVPEGSHAEQGEDLGDVVALGAHVGRAPHHEADGAGIRAGLGHVAFDQPVGQRPADVPRQRRGHRLGVDGVEVATGRQHVGAAPRGCPAGAGGHVAAGEAGEQVGELVGRAPQVGHQRRGDPAQRRVVTRAPTDPSPRAARASTRDRHAASSRSIVPGARRTRGRSRARRRPSPAATERCPGAGG